MKVQKHWLDEEKNAYFTEFLLDDYTEFQQGKKRPAVIVCPGGGYQFVSQREGEPVALHFLKEGYQAFVLNYTVGSPENGNVLKTAICQAAQLIAYIRDNCDALFVDPDKIAIIGFSAGAHLSASLSVNHKEAWLKEMAGTGETNLRPDACILSYPWVSMQAMHDRMAAGDAEPNTCEYMPQANIAMIGHPDPIGEGFEICSPYLLVDEDTPPTYIWHTSNDELVFVECSLDYARALSDHRVPFEMHIFENGHHGLALCDEVTETRPVDIKPLCKQWLPLMFAWLKTHIEY